MEDQVKCENINDMENMASIAKRVFPDLVTELRRMLEGKQ